MREAVPPLLMQEQEGLYDEELQKLVDGVEGDIISGYVKTQQDAKRQLLDAVTLSDYIADPDLQTVVLKYSKQAKILTKLFGDRLSRFDREVVTSVCMKTDACEKLSRSVHFFVLSKTHRKAE